MTHANDGTIRSVSGEAANAAADRLEAKADTARARGEHLWIVAAAYLISEQAAREAMDSAVPTSLILDAENLGSLSIGCYVCEEPATARTMHRRCRGEHQQ